MRQFLSHHLLDVLHCDPADRVQRPIKILGRLVPRQRLPSVNLEVDGQRHPDAEAAAGAALSCTRGGAHLAIVGAEAIRLAHARSTWPRGHAHAHSAAILLARAVLEVVAMLEPVLEPRLWERPAIPRGEELLVDLRHLGLADLKGRPPRLVSKWVSQRAASHDH